MPVIRMSISTASISKAITEVEQYRDRVKKSAEEIARRLSLMGYDVAYQIMSGHIYSGATLNSLTIVEKSPTKFVLMAGSKALLFFEFGAGVIGYGHPLAGKFGMGPGTFPDQKHALDPNGWWFPTDDPNLILRKDKDGQGWGHSYGNEPHMPFYEASRKMRDDLLQVAKEVMRDD